MTATPAHAAPTPTEPDLSGRRLGDYQFLRRLGRGGMAEVYLAEQLSLRRQVAMKVLRSTLAGDEAYVRRFHREAQAAAKLVHANIVAIHEVGCVEGWHYIAQEYVPGQNLKQLLTRQGRNFDAPQAASIIRQVAAALHKAAEQNITHRDIKPENIMLSSSGEVKVADFGLARIAQAGEALNLTQVGITMGTPLYMSPEQVEGKEVDPRSDIYSLGVTCYHMLAGRPPFDGDTALAVAVQHLKSEPQRLEVLRPDLPEGLCRIVHTMLAKQPKDRYQKAIDLLKDLKSLRIPGLNSDWADDLPGWNPGEGSPGLQGRLDATGQLGRAMQTEPDAARALWTSGRIALLVLGLAVCGFLVGTAAAWISPPQPLLPFPHDRELGIRQFDSVREQYIYATMAPLEQEQAWQAVGGYFPPAANPENLRYSRLAAKGLAAYYLSHEQLPQARKLYEELAAINLEAEPTEGEFRLAGVAGCAIIADRLDEEVPRTICLVILYEASEQDLNKIGNFLLTGVEDLFERFPKPAE